MRDGFAYLLIGRPKYEIARQVVSEFKEWLAEIEQPNTKVLGLLEQRLRGPEVGFSEAKTSKLRNQPADLSKAGLQIVLDSYSKFLSGKLRWCDDYTAKLFDSK